MNSDQGSSVSILAKRVPMATNPAQAQQQLPLFYKSLAPLSSQLHPNHVIQTQRGLEFTRNAHAIPLTVDEFVAAQRFYPIVFTTGPNPAPLALLGLHDGVNTYLDAEGQWRANTYIPAYIRRYPFMLAKLTPESTELSLCFDDQSGVVVEGEGERLFDNGQPTEATRNILGFCEQFEQSVARTQAFCQDLEKLDILMDGEATIQQPGMAQPAIYRGFRMVSEEKLQAIRGDQTRKIVQNGMLGLIYAHLFSLALLRELFAQQAASGLGPAPVAPTNG